MSKIYSLQMKSTRTIIYGPYHSACVSVIHILDTPFCVSMIVCVNDANIGYAVGQIDETNLLSGIKIGSDLVE